MKKAKKTQAKGKLIQQYLLIGMPNIEPIRQNPACYGSEMNIAINLSINALKETSSIYLYNYSPRNKPSYELVTAITVNWIKQKGDSNIETPILHEMNRWNDDNFKVIYTIQEMKQQLTGASKDTTVVIVTEKHLLAFLLVHIGIFYGDNRFLNDIYTLEDQMRSRFFEPLIFKVEILEIDKSTAQNVMVTTNLSQK